MKSVIARLLAVSGAVYSLMEIAGDSLSSTPSSSQTPAQIAAYLTAHSPTTATWAGMLIETLGVFAFLFFGLYLWSLAENHPEGRLLGVLALSAGLIQAAIILTGEPPKAAAFLRVAQGMQPQVAAALIDINNGSFLAGFMAQALMVAAGSGLALKMGVFPRWLGALGMAVALGLVAVVAAPVGSGAAVAMNLVFFVWLAVTSAILAWRVPASAHLWSGRRAPV